MNETRQSKKISIGLILSWLLGILFGLMGIIYVFSQPVPGIIMLIMGAVLLPPVLRLVDQKWKFHLSRGIKIMVVIIGLIIFGATINTSDSGADQKFEASKEKQQITNNEVTTKDQQIEKQVNTEQSQIKSDDQVITPSTIEEKVETLKNNIEPKEVKAVVASFGSGTHIIGIDIQAGTYRSQKVSTCYWARLSGFSEELDDIIANGNNSSEIITISASDVAFKTSGCGQWVAVESTYPVTPLTTFSDGTYEIGKHIESGTYRADGDPDDFCYWARLSNFSRSGINGVLINGNSPTVIKISGSDKGFTAFGCGNWAKI